MPRCRLEPIDTAHREFVELFQRFSGDTLTPALCQRIALNVEFLIENTVFDYIFQTLAQYVGRLLTPRLCDMLSRQLVARRDVLACGVILPFEEPTSEEWIPLEIYKMAPCIWREDDCGQMVTFYCLAGHPAGHLLTKKFPEGWLAWLAYQIGFSRRLPYDYDPEILVGLRFWGKLKVGLTPQGELDVEDWDIDRQCRTWNRSIICRRSRFDVDTSRLSDTQAPLYSCPFELEDYCSECRHSVHECIACPNRDRTYVRRVFMDEETPVAGGPGRG